MTPVISATALGRRYRDQVALEDVSLVVGRARARRARHDPPGHHLTAGPAQAVGGSSVTRARAG
jgi:hypothetical protein